MLDRANLFIEQLYDKIISMLYELSTDDIYFVE